MFARSRCYDASTTARPWHLNTFEKLFASTKASHLESLKKSIVREAAAKPAGTLAKQYTKNRLDRLDAKAALWAVRAPYLAIRELKLSAAEAFAAGLSEQATNVSDPKTITKVHASVWKKIFGIPGTPSPQSAPLLVQ